MYRCGLALFTAQGPAVASALIAFFNQMVFVQSRIAMLDISALAFGLLAIAAFISGFRKRRPHVWFALAGRGWLSVFRSPANGADCLRWRSVSSSSL
jgi:dolichyl-phosphate-mannose-protein mannosyltransferase